jgi:RsiW-degrading membrane proteinase PrsW (M82 family)
MIFVTIAIIVAATLLPTFIWFLFFLKEDPHPEPKRLIIYTFGIGVLVSLPALFFQLFFQRFIFGDGPNAFLLSIVCFALIEEVFKFLAAYLSVRSDPAFDEPVDAMIYLIIAALGFATVENFFIVTGTITTSLAVSLEALSLRFVGATLLHTLSSGLLGYYWARSITHEHKLSFLLRGVIYAVAIHSVFNYLVIRFQESNLIYPSLFLIFIVFILLNDFEKIKTGDAAAS